MALGKKVRGQAAIGFAAANARVLAGQAAIELPSATARRLLGQAAIESPSGATAGSLHGQAAMEYLVTYGWAILALFVVIGFLLSSGAFSPTGFAVQECVFQPDIPCQNFILYKNVSDPTASPNTVLQFSLVNGMGFPIELENVTYIASDLGNAGKQSYTDVSEPETTVKSGARMDFTHAFTGSKQPDSKSFRTVIVQFTYYNCKPGATKCTGPYTSSGRISAIVEDASVK